MNTLPTSDVTIKHSSVSENTLVSVFSLQFMHTEKNYQEQCSDYCFSYHRLRDVFTNVAVRKPHSIEISYGFAAGGTTPQMGFQLYVKDQLNT